MLQVVWPGCQKFLQNLFAGIWCFIKSLILSSSVNYRSLEDKYVCSSFVPDIVDDKQVSTCRWPISSIIIWFFLNEAYAQILNDYNFGIFWTAMLRATGCLEETKPSAKFHSIGMQQTAKRAFATALSWRACIAPAAAISKIRRGWIVPFISRRNEKTRLYCHCLQKQKSWFGSDLNRWDVPATEGLLQSVKWTAVWCVLHFKPLRDLQHLS